MSKKCSKKELIISVITFLLLVFVFYLLEFGVSPKVQALCGSLQIDFIRVLLLFPLVFPLVEIMMQNQVESRFIDPHRRPVTQVRLVATVMVTLFGVGVLFQSYSMAGTAMEWRISAGVAAVSFSFLSLLDKMLSLPGWAEFIRWTSAITLYLVGVVCFLILVPGQKSEWAKTILLESGVSCLFVAAIDFFLGAFRASAAEAERAQREFYDELALAAGYTFDLTLWQYRGMRDMLDVAVKQGRGRTVADRVILLADFARKGKSLPAHLDLPTNPEFKAAMDREWPIAMLTAEASRSHGLTNKEHLYLASVIATRADPSFSQEPIDPACLPMVVENSAELIIQKRPQGVKRFAFWQDWDPLGAGEELEKRDQRIPPCPVGAFGRDETAVEEDTNT